MAAGSHALSAVVRRNLDTGAASAPLVDLAPPAPLRAVLTTAAAGDVSDPAVWRRVCEALGIGSERVRRVAQRHTRRVMATRDRPPGADLPDGLPADGLIARSARDVLCVTIADCLPIFLIPRDGELPALLHSGWRGTGIATDALGCLERRFGRSPGAYRAIIGPGIGPCCYDVPAERALSFRARFGPDSAEVAGGAGRIDLRAANIALLRRAGVAGITVYDDCTACSPALISFRAERASGRAGVRRMAALLGRFESERPRCRTMGTGTGRPSQGTPCRPSAT